MTEKEIGASSSGKAQFILLNKNPWESLSGQMAAFLVVTCFLPEINILDKLGHTMLSAPLLTSLLAAEEVVREGFTLS